MAFVADQFFYTDMASQSDEYFDFDQFLDPSATYGDDNSASVNSISPEMALPYDAGMLSNDLPEFSQPAFTDIVNYETSPETTLGRSPNMGWMQEHAPVCDEAMSPSYQLYDASFDFRHMVEAQAAADPRIASAKEKRREAAIALHLQRLCDATALEVDMSSDSNTSFSSPNVSDYMRESFSPQPVNTNPEDTSAPPPGQGMELVLDLNMNATTNLPKKQKPRSQAQKENYIKARKYGACEKHKKQHKRCNCLEKAAARAGVSEVPMDAGFKQRPKHTGLPTPMLLASRSSDAPRMPGYLPSITPPGLRPTAKVIKRLATTAPSRYDTSLFASPLQQSTRSTAVHDGTPVHNPQFRPTVVQPTVQDGTHAHGSPGHAPSSILQHGNAPRMPIILNNSWPASIGYSRTNNFVLCTENKNPSQTSSGTSTSNTRALDLVVRRPRIEASMRQVTDGFPSPAVNAKCAHTPEPGCSPGVVEVSATNRRQVILEGTKQSPAIPTTSAVHALQSKNHAMGGAVSTRQSGPNSSIIRSAISQIGCLFARTVLLVDGLRRSSLSFVSCSKQLMYRGLSFAGKHLMSVKRGLELYHMRTFWSV